MVPNSSYFRWVTLIAFIASIVPIPTVVWSPKGKDVQAFPCQYSTCGCSTAEQCWRSCCCHNDEEKLVWAKQNGVTPPAWFVAKAVAKEETVKNSCCSSKKTQSCCQSSKSPSEKLAPELQGTEKQTASKVAPHSKSCCQKSHSASTNPKAHSTSPSKSRWVVMDDALKCRGVSFGIDKGVVRFVQAIESIQIDEGHSPYVDMPINNYSLECESPPTPPPMAASSFLV